MARVEVVGDRLVVVGGTVDEVKRLWREVASGKGTMSGSPAFTEARAAAPKEAHAMLFVDPTALSDHFREIFKPLMSAPRAVSFAHLVMAPSTRGVDFVVRATGPIDFVAAEALEELR
jgi:hypothetical protein